MPFRLPVVFDVASVALFTVLAVPDGTSAPRAAWEGPTGMLLGGLGVFIYFITKAIIEAKTRTVERHNVADSAAPAMWQKLQEVLDSQRIAHQELIKTLESLNEDILKNRELTIAHDSYIKEHVNSRGPEIAREIGSSIAPLVVNAIRGAFEDDRMRKIAERTTEGHARVATRRKKSTRRTE
jgi:hypothetical protein